MISKHCKFPFLGLLGYKQYLPNGRCYIYLRNPKTDKRRLISRARYRMCVKLGRILEKWEHVDHIDHIDGDKTNDSVRNLQILTVSQNNSKSVIQNNKQKRFIKLSCVVCGTTFRRDLRLHRMRMKEGNLPTCSRTCGGRVFKLRREGLL